MIELLRVANRPLTLRLRRVGRERLLRRRAEMRALTHPQGVFLGSSGGTASSTATSTVGQAGGGGTYPGVTAVGPAAGEGAGASHLQTRCAPPESLPLPPRPPLPPLPPPPPPPIRELRRQDSFPLGRPRAMDAAGDGDGGNASEAVEVSSAVGADIAGAGEVADAEGASAVPGEASVAARGGAGAVVESGAREQVVAAAVVAAAGVGGMGNWEAVEWAESCLLTVRAVLV